MITLEEMFRGKMDHPDATEERLDNARDLLEKVSKLFVYLEYEPKICPNTGCQISGSLHGDGDGGFRLQSSKTGAVKSSHKEGQAVDVYDPGGKLDMMLNDKILSMFELYREHPSETPGWCHLTTRAPRSGRRTFYP